MSTCYTVGSAKTEGVNVVNKTLNVKHYRHCREKWFDRK
jgi:hypothetical protein